MTLDYYLQLMGWLALLIGILFAVLYLSRTYRIRHYHGNIKIVDRLPIDTQVSLLVVEVRQKTYLMSLGGKDLKLLRCLDE